MKDFLFVSWHGKAIFGLLCEQKQMPTWKNFNLWSYISTRLLFYKRLEWMGSRSCLLLFWCTLVLNIVYDPLKKASGIFACYYFKLCFCFNVTHGTNLCSVHFPVQHRWAAEPWRNPRPWRCCPDPEHISPAEAQTTKSQKHLEHTWQTAFWVILTKDCMFFFLFFLLKLQSIHPVCCCFVNITYRLSR